MDPLTILSDEEVFFQNEIQKFALKQIAPKVASMDESEQIDPAIIEQCFAMGLMGIEIPEKFGGAGGSFFQSILAIEEIAKVDPGVSVFVDVQNTLVNNILSRWGTESQKEIFYPKLVKDHVGCFCLTEPNSGSDAFSLTSRAYLDGDSWCLEGKKIFITNANEASIFVIFANIKPEDGYKGITAFIVEKGMQGLSIGKKEKKLGIRASSTCEVIFENLRVPKENVIGDLGKGYKIAIETLNEGRIGIAAQMLGLADGAYHHALKYTHEREQFGKKINSFQSVQFQLAKMRTEIEACRLLVYNAARLKDAKKPFTREAAMAKYFVSEVSEQVASLSLELLGGYGFIKEFPLEKYYRDVKIGKIYEGTSNLQLQTIYKLCSSDI
ncbi:MAG: acyl-CoA dehydrogenase [Zetaproteobacteria bacterium]|nr:acyl-CoA dehydrogenase [Pseudobdellovibrionaceae bacterium]